MARYDISETGSGSLMDALAELNAMAAATPEPVEVPSADTPRWVIEPTDADGVPMFRRSTSPARPARAARTTMTHASAIRAAAPPTGARGGVAVVEETRVPSLADRIDSMPRFRADAGHSHPTGAHWVEPAKRQLLGRPPA